MNKPRMQNWKTETREYIIPTQLMDTHNVDKDNEDKVKMIKKEKFSGTHGSGVYTKRN